MTAPLTQNAPKPDMIVVGLGDCRVAGPPVTCISTYALGSCVAVIAWDWKAHVGGLLHVMLPDSSIDPQRAVSQPCVYADTGLPHLLRELSSQGGIKNRMRWSLAGGASMMANSAHFEIGKRNYLAVKKALWRLGLFVDREDVGGTESRSVFLDLATGQIELRRGAGREKTLNAPTANFKIPAVSVPALQHQRNPDDASITR